MSPTKHTAWRTVAGAAALAVAGIGTLVAPNAAHADGPAATSISIRALHSKIQPGKTDTITGDLTIKGVQDESGRQVTLEARSSGETDFTPVGVATTASRGGISLTVVPQVTTKYRWDYAGASDARPRLSGVVTVKVGSSNGGTPSRQPTTLSIRATHPRVDSTGSDIVRGRLRTRGTELPNRTVILLSRVAGQQNWTFSDSGSTDKDGTAIFTVHPAVATTYELRYLGSEVFRPSHSGVVHVGVRATVSVSASPLSIDTGQTTAISGVASYQGVPVNGGTVSLLARPAHTNQAFQVVGTGTTLADGSVSITATPTVDTKYRLRLEANGDVPASVSPAILVVVRYPSSLSIRGKSNPDAYVVSGSLRGHGQAIAGVTVLLLAEAQGTTTFTQVGSATTDQNGYVKFSQADVKGTTYELQYGGDDRFAATTSGTVVD